jgi:DNA-binding transcriptional MerR regulator
VTELDIAEVARRAGVPASTLRYYEERGLIRSLGRQGLRRQYAVSVLERLALIALGRAAGFSLEEIGEMLAGGGVPKIDRQRLKRRADELDHTINRLVVMRDGLRHAAVCRAPSHLECPTFKRILKAVMAGKLVGREPGASRRRGV